MATKRSTDRRRLEQRVAALAKHFLGQLGIAREWSVATRVCDDEQFENTGHTVQAETEWPLWYRSAEIRVKPTLTPDVEERVMLHEVLHLYFADIHDKIFELLGHSLTSREIYAEEEKLIDRLTNLLLEGK